MRVALSREALRTGAGESVDLCHPELHVSQPSRIERERLDAVDFPIRVEVPLRFSDLDTLGHVNNAAVGVILQEARVGFSQHAALPGLDKGFRTVVAGLRIEFAAELLYPGAVEVCMGIVAVGRTSFTLVQVGRQNGLSALYAEVTLVMSSANGPTPIPDELRAALERLRIIPSGSAVKG
jgi:acyl-CoA thioester hydrolase